MHVAQQPTKHRYTHANELSCCTRMTQGRKDESMRVKEGGREIDYMCVQYLCLEIADLIFNVETGSKSICSLSLEISNLDSSSPMCQKQRAVDRVIIHVSRQIERHLSVQLHSNCLSLLNVQLNIHYKKTKRVQSASNTNPYDIMQH